jgi:hypothetical protein
MASVKRKHGTIVTVSQTTDEKISAIREIVTNKQYAKIDGVMVDLFSASAIITVYDHIDGPNREMFAKMPIAKMAAIAFKVIK